MNNHLHVAMSSDNKYAMFAGISIYSLFKNNTSFENITIHILDNGLDTDNKAHLLKIADEFNRAICFYDCSSIQNWLGKDITDLFVHEITNITISTYARLFLPKILNESIDKVLYLDCDSITLGSYKDLWSIDNSQFSVMGVIDNVSEIAKRKVGLNKNHNYINAGVVLLNLKMLRKINFIDKFKSFIDKHSGRVFHHDQGIINAVLSDSIGYLPPQYNMMSFVFESSNADTIKSLHDLPYYYSNEEISYAKKYPVFIHFTEGNLQRPWVKGCKHPLKSQWELYKSKTIWSDVSLLPDKRPLKLKILAWINLNLPFINKLIKGIRK